MLGELPVEILIEILQWNANQSELAALSLLSSTFCIATQHVLFSSIKVQSLESFDLLLRTLDRRGSSKAGRGGEVGVCADEDEWVDEEIGRAEAVRRVEVKCVDKGIKGWGSRVGRLLKLCTRVQHLNLIGIEDFRIKWLYGVGHLRSLSLTTITFRGNSQPTSPHLYQTLANLSSIRLMNLGLPFPCLHPYFLLSSSPSLLSATISDLRDLSPELLQSALLILACTTSLKTLKLLNLTLAQQQILPQVLPKFTSLTFLNLLAPFNWMAEDCDFTILAPSVKVIKLSSLKKQYGSLEKWEPVIEALGKGFGRKASRLEVSNLDGWLRAEPLEKLRKAVEAAGLTFSARLA